MYTQTKFITDYENEREIEKTSDYFDFGSYEFVEYSGDDNGFIKHKNRDVTIIYLRYNNKVRSVFLYGDLVGLFTKPIIEEYEVLLKGDMFLVYSKTDSDLTVYNISDWTIIKNIDVTSHNLRTTAKRITGETVRKQFLYWHQGLFVLVWI